MDNKLPKDIESELAANHGFMQGSNFVLMSMDVYREAIGMLAENELQDSLAKIEHAVMDINEGRTRPLVDAVNDLGANV